MSFIDRFIPTQFQTNNHFPSDPFGVQLLGVGLRLAFSAVAVFVLTAAAALALRLVINF